MNLLLLRYTSRVIALASGYINIKKPLFGVLANPQILAVLLFVGVGAAASADSSKPSPTAGKQVDLSYSPTTSPVIVNLEIGDKKFVIPKNYIWSREDWKGGKVDGVNLHALLPAFQPYTKENHNEFDKSGWGRKITLVLLEHATKQRPAVMTRQTIYGRITKGRSVIEKEGPFGLKTVLIDQRPPDPELYIGKKDDGQFYWVECSRESKVKFPSCRTKVEYSDNVYIHYTFGKSELSEWQAIERGVFELVGKFDTTRQSPSKK